MSNISVNTITDALGGSTASINGLTPQASNMQPHNLIINGAMTVAQRGTSFTSQTGAAYHLDRWKINAYNLGAGQYRIDQSTDAPDGFSFSNKVSCTTAEAAQNANEQMYFQQQVEAQNMNWLKFYQANADQVTISFWAKSNRTGSFSATLKLSDNNSVENNTNTRAYFFTYSISTSNTWEQKTKTITLDTDVTQIKSTGVNFGMAIDFWLGAGSSRKGATANSWLNNGNAATLSDNLDMLGSTANDFYITGVQLEAGSSASSFAYENYSDTLQKCQRYYYRLDNLSINAAVGTGFNQNTTNSVVYIAFPSSMRDTPSSLETTGTAGEYDVLNLGVVNINTAVPTFQFTSSWGGYMNWEKSTGGKVAGQGCIGRLRSGTNTFLAWSAEL
jgi:hypothetical protein